MLKQYDVAATYLTRAIALYRESGNLFREGKTLNYLGSVHAGLGKQDMADQYWREAHVILESLGLHAVAV